MSLFFDAAWFDDRLAQRGLDRGALAAAAGISRDELHLLFVNQRVANADELAMFAEVLGADLVEVTLRAGIAEAAPAAAGASARIENIEARLDAIDRWLAEFEQAKKRA